MSYSVKQGNIFGRIGSGIGQGLSEQVPKEIERYRLSEGLKQLESDPNLTPTQRYAGLLTLPGMTPQGLQGYSDLARQEMRGKALGEGASSPIPFPMQPEINQEKPSQVPSLTQESTFAKAQEGFIPRSEPEKMDAAGKKYNANPAFFGNDPQKAIEYENQIDATNEKIALANQAKHENLSRIQDNVVSRLGEHAKNLEAQVPANVYSKIEDEAIQATKPKSEGGRGLTEQQAMKEYGEKLDEISRDYKSLDSIGNWGITQRKSKDTLGSLNSLQKKFEQRNDTENFADTLVANNGLSDPMAYSIAQPISREPALNKEMKSISDLNKNFSRLKPVDPILKTKEIAPRLARALGEKGSPLAVAHELEKLGYDGSTWLDYVNEHRDELGLKEWQGRQLDKPRNLIPKLNDWWLSSFTGVQ